MIKKTYYLLFFILLFSCRKEDLYECNPTPFSPTPFTIASPPGFPTMIIPEDNQTTLEGVALGEKIFNDVILSRNQTISCASCHIQNNSFSDPNQYSFGVDGLTGNRNASAIINLGWSSNFNWDGSASSLEEQAFEPITNHLEMDNTWENVENRLNTHSEYPRLFKNCLLYTSPSPRDS